MHEPEKSHPVVVAAKPVNNAERSAAEMVEPRTGTEGTRISKARAGRKTGVACHRGWNAYGKPQGNGRRRSSPRSSTILPRRCCGPAFHAIRRDAAPGVDGETWADYEKDLDRRIAALHSKIHSGGYRALPSQRSWIPKEDGSKRLLAVTALVSASVKLTHVAH